MGAHKFSSLWFSFFDISTNRTTKNLYIYENKPKHQQDVRETKKYISESETSEAIHRNNRCYPQCLYECCCCCVCSFFSFYTFGSIFGWCFSDRWRLNYAQIKCFLINFPVVWVKVGFFALLSPYIHLVAVFFLTASEKKTCSHFIYLTNTLWCPAASDTRNICKFSNSKDNETKKQTNEKTNNHIRVLN